MQHKRVTAKQVKVSFVEQFSLVSKSLEDAVHPNLRREDEMFPLNDPVGGLLSRRSLLIIRCT